MSNQGDKLDEFNQTTGRYLVMFDEDNIEEGIECLKNSAGVRNIARVRDFENSAVDMAQVKDADTLVFDEVAAAVIEVAPDQIQSMNFSLASSGNNSIIALEPERKIYSFNAPLPPEYLKGYRDAVVELVNKITNQPTISSVTKLDAPVLELPGSEKDTTWGLSATKVLESEFTGRGVKIAILDTGFDMTHPDFSRRHIVVQSFVENEGVQDTVGHGTHCIGTAAGAKKPSILTRYGIAYEADIYAGKVLGDEGSGRDGDLLLGINWAIANHCEIISMSLGAMALPGQRYSPVYEVLGKRALKRGSLIIAAAGNDSRRGANYFAGVSHPANCPSIMAVAAVDHKLEVADFSNRGVNPEGGQIDIAGPGVDIYSSFTMPKRYITISGTSMATPHVSGIAALYVEATGARGMNLWNLLIQNAKRLEAASMDVGSGLVQAP